MYKKSAPCLESSKGTTDSDESGPKACMPEDNRSSIIYWFSISFVSNNNSNRTQNNSIL